jgi:hypothetical protein
MRSETRALYLCLLAAWLARRARSAPDGAEGGRGGLRAKAKLRGGTKASRIRRSGLVHPAETAARQEAARQKFSISSSVRPLVSGTW